MKISKFLDYKDEEKMIFSLFLFLSVIPIRTVLFSSDIVIVDYMEQSKSFSQQGAAAFGDYLFQFTAEMICDIYDLKNKKHIGKMVGDSSPIKHCDTVCFGIDKYDSDDPFPVIYISGALIGLDEKESYIWVYRILNDNNVWSLNLVQTIVTPITNEIGCCPDALISKKNGYLWIVGWDYAIPYNQENGVGARLKLTKFGIPSLQEELVSLCIEDSISRLIVDNAHAIQQGMCIDDDSIFVPYGDSVLGYQGIDVIDINKGKVVKNIDLNNTRVSEPEAVFFYQGEIFIADQATTIKHIIKY